jgi:drug/metabolite transporter (DMT)-like permease
MAVSWMTSNSGLQRMLLIAPFFLWGTAMVAMKGILPETEPLFLGALRLLPAGILVILIALWLGKSHPQGWRAWGWIGLFALIDGSLFQGLLAHGLARTSAGLGSVMIDSQPLAVALLARFLYQERIGLWGWLGLLVGIAGISCIGFPDEWVVALLQGNVQWQPLTWQGWTTVQALFDRGEVWMLGAALSMAVGTVMIQRVSRYSDPVMATGWHMVLGGLPLLAGSLFSESHRWDQLSLNGGLAIAYSTIFGSAIAYGLFFFYASRGNLTSLSALTFLTPVFALIFGNVFLAEMLTPVQFSGVFLTLVSIYLVNQRDRIPGLAQFKQMLQFAPVSDASEWERESQAIEKVPVSVSSRE